MVWRLLVIYAVVELAVVLLLGMTIGFGWTLLMLLAAVVLGFVLLAPLGGWQLGRRLLQARSGDVPPRRVLGDGAVVGVATGLVLIPGLVTTAVGLILLLPPIRAAVTPGLTGVVMRGLLRRVGLSPEAVASIASVVNRGPSRNAGNFIDGEVIDVVDVEPSALPQDSLGGDSPARPTPSS